MPHTGNSSTPYEEVQAFYRYWSTFATKRGFHGADQWNTREVRWRCRLSFAAIRSTFVRPPAACLPLLMLMRPGCPPASPTCLPAYGPGGRCCTQASNRRVKRAMEKENNQARNVQRKKYNAIVHVSSSTPDATSRVCYCAFNFATFAHVALAVTSMTHAAVATNAATVGICSAPGQACNFT